MLTGGQLADTASLYSLSVACCHMWLLPFIFQLSSTSLLNATEALGSKNVEFDAAKKKKLLLTIVPNYFRLWWPLLLIQFLDGGFTSSFADILPRADRLQSFSFYNCGHTSSLEVANWETMAWMGDC